MFFKSFWLVSSLFSPAVLLLFATFLVRICQREIVSFGYYGIQKHKKCIDCKPGVGISSAVTVEKKFSISWERPINLINLAQLRIVVF